jgi:prepilin-type N-terminal cleavage/methylation domain-containing protein
MFNPRKNKKGFTIIELIVVIAIIAILAAIAIPAFIGITKQADDRVLLANAKMIANAINVHNTLYPTDLILSASDISKLDDSLKPRGIDDFDAALGIVLFDTDGYATVPDDYVSE